jgi:hypothetical protein
MPSAAPIEPTRLPEPSILLELPDGPLGRAAVDAVRPSGIAQIGELLLGSKDQWIIRFDQPRHEELGRHKNHSHVPFPGREA